MAPDTDERIPLWQMPLLALFDAGTIAAIPLLYLRRKIKMKRILLCTAVCVTAAIQAAPAVAGNYNYSTGDTVEVVNPNPPTEKSWSGVIVGLQGGVSNSAGTLHFSEDIYETDVRDVLENQCWKFWRKAWNRQLDDAYCSGDYENWMNRHYFDHAKVREDVVVGEEEYQRYVGTDKWEETVSETEFAYGGYLGYWHDTGALVIGAEASYIHLDSDVFDYTGVTTVSAKIGYDAGPILPYGHIGYSWLNGTDDQGMSYGGGVDVALGDRLHLGVIYTQYEFTNYEMATTMARVGLHF